MNAEVRLLFHELVDLSPAERERILAERQVGADVRAEVESLLGFHSADTLTGCVASAAADLLNSCGTPEPSHCGQYRLIRLLGGGGMGAVYLAERIDGEIQQRVAIKLLHAGNHRPAWRDRFLMERQLLASLNHPSIVHLIDAGHTEDGRPYLVMEYVQGTPIDAACEPLELRDRLAVFLRVCEGVSHAHGRLIIHRDLKPSNILVDNTGQPKVLDFGIAKLLGDEGDATRTGERLLTPNYASPEQLCGESQTTASDVYSLGAVLWKLLTSQSPRESQANPAPNPPNQPADLGFILRKAVRAEAEERYTSVEALANDIRAFLDSRPVEARSGSVWYRSRKFVRCYRVPVVAALLVFASLAAGLYATNRQRAIAERRFALARRLANSLVFDADDKASNASGGIELREQISSTAVEYLDVLSKEAGNNYALRRELAAGYLRLAAAQYAGSEAAPRRPGGQTALDSVNRGLALLARMPSSEAALASATEAGLLDRRCSILYQSSQHQAARSDCDRAVALLPCSAAHPAQCQNRVFALLHSLDVYTALRDWPACEVRMRETRGALETQRASGDERFSDSNLLGAGTHEATIADLRGEAPAAVEICRRLRPTAERLGARSQLRPEELYALYKYYFHFLPILQRTGEGTPEEGIELGRKGLAFARRRAALDPADIVAQFAVGDMLEMLARRYESVDPAETARLIQEAIEPFVQHPDAVAHNLAPKVSLFVSARFGVRFFLRTHRPAEALKLARRASAAINPALFLKLDLPRSPEAIQLQALWWTATEASEEKLSSAAGLWKEADCVAEEGLRAAANDGMIQATAAFVFEGRADSLSATGHEQEAADYRQKAQSLWRTLNAAHPQNDFIAKRCAGVKIKHETEVGQANVSKRPH
jgi:serine/threonine protein kinase